MWKTLCHSAQRREQHPSEGTRSKEKHIFESGETLSFNVCKKMPKLKNFSTHCCKVISVDRSQASKCIWGYVFSRWLFEYVHRAQHSRTEVDYVSGVLWEISKCVVIIFFLQFKHVSPLESIVIDMNPRWPQLLSVKAHTTSTEQMSVCYSYLILDSASL